MLNYDMRALAERAKAASRVLGLATTAEKNRALQAIGQALLAREKEILAANAADMDAGRAAGLSAAMLDRLLLTPQRLAGVAASLADVVALEDPVGEVTERRARPNGLQIHRVRIPLGTILIIYESRPNVTVDAAALCLKSGNACILRGGSEAARSNAALAAAIGDGLEAAGLPRDAVVIVPTSDRGAMLELLLLEDVIDLCIPRGGEGLIRFVAENARVPVIKHYKGVCHTYVHRSASVEKAISICYNAKVQRPGVCNATEALLVDREIAPSFLPAAAARLAKAGVELRCDPESLAILAGLPAAKPAAPEDFGKEFLDLILAVRVVDDLDGALDHIARYGSMHTEAILAEDPAAAERFVREVVASCVVVNASTRFNDGGELGLGAEIGVSTTKLHAFGPMGLRELCTQKYVVEGTGQVRT